MKNLNLSNRKIRSKLNRIILESFTPDDVDAMKVENYSVWDFIYTVRSRNGWELSFALYFPGRDIIPRRLRTPSGEVFEFGFKTLPGLAPWWITTLFQPFARFLYRCRKAAIKKNNKKLCDAEWRRRIDAKNKEKRHASERLAEDADALAVLSRWTETN